MCKTTTPGEGYNYYLDVINELREHILVSIEILLTQLEFNCKSILVLRCIKAELCYGHKTRIALLGNRRYITLSLHSVSLEIVKAKCKHQSSFELKAREAFQRGIGVRSDPSIQQV